MMIRTAPGSQRALREANAARIRQAIVESGPLSHAQIARHTGLSPATVSNLVRDLVAAGRVQVEDGIVDGRKARVVSPTRAAGVVAAIDLGRTHMRVSVADLARSILAEEETAMVADAPAREGVVSAAAFLRQQLEAIGRSEHDVMGIGVGVPGPLDVATGRIGAGALLPPWVGIDIRAAFQDELGLPVVVENDANLGAVGEFAWTPEPGDRNIAYIRLTTGIGSGLVLGGELYRGSAGTAGEVGHMTIDEAGPLCRCGNRGCLETLASVPVVLEQLRQSLGRSISVDELVEMAGAGDIACRRVIEDMGRNVGVAVANLCNVINPSRVVLGGPITGVGDLLFEPVRETVRRRAIPTAAASVRIERAKHGRRSESYGALILAARAFAEV